MAASTPPVDIKVLQLEMLERRTNDGLLAAEAHLDELRGQWSPLLESLDEREPGFRKLLLMTLVQCLFEGRGRALAKVIRAFGLDDVAESIWQSSDMQIAAPLMALLIERDKEGELIGDY